MTLLTGLDRSTILGTIPMTFLTTGSTLEFYDTTGSLDRILE